MLRERLLKRKTIAVIVIAVVLIGWFAYALNLYTNQILIVNIEGAIYDFSDTYYEIYNGKNDGNVKAIVLNLNTPGGGADPCWEIAYSVNETKTVKPVIASMAAQCASGGYYIASFADYIFTHNKTVTGSVGVITVWYDLSNYYDKEGITIYVWKSGPEKDLGAAWRPPTEGEKAALQGEVDRIFKEMIDVIQKNRGLTDEIIDKIDGGAIYSGSKAVDELGLADEIGNLIDAQEKAMEAARLDRAIAVTPEMSGWDRFLKALFLDTIVLTSKEVETIEITSANST